MIKHPFIAILVFAWFFTYNLIPAFAGIVESQPISQEIKPQRDLELQKIQRALENKIVQEKLKAYGLTKEEIEKKLSELSDEQIHILAKASEKVLSGGDALGAVVTLLVILILVVILLKLLNKEIIIR